MDALIEDLVHLALATAVLIIVLFVATGLQFDRLSRRLAKLEAKLSPKEK